MVKIPHQIIYAPNGEPMYVLIPIEEYHELWGKPVQQEGIPAAIVDAVTQQGISWLRAFREAAGRSEKDMAVALGLDAKAYQRIEKTSFPALPLLELAAVELDNVSAEALLSLYRKPEEQSADE